MPTRPPRTLDVRRRLRRTVLPILVAVTAAVAGVGVSVQPASAHNNAYPWFNFQTYNDGRQCTFVDASQNHGPPYSRSSTYSRTYSMWSAGPGAECVNPHNQHPYWLGQKGVLYKNGVFCLAGDWQYNTQAAWYVTWESPENLWYRCNFNDNRPTQVSHDLYQKVFNPHAFPGREWWNWSEARWGGPKGTFPTTYHSYPEGPTKY